MRKLRWFLLVLAVFCAASVRAELVEYYIGRDNRSTPFDSPAAPEGDGLPYADNPNLNRLTFLFAHPDEVNPASNHYHGIGAYIYTGPSTSPVLNDTNGNNRIPETFTGQAPLSLTSGDGLYTGKLVSKADPDTHYSDLRLRSIDSLEGFAAGTPEHFLFNSSDERWNETMAGSNVLLELVSISAGLNVGSASDLNLFPGGVGTTFDLGPGDVIDFTPVFWTDASAAPGAYSAEFRLHDSAATSFADSGRFHLDFQIVPEPSTMFLAVSASLIVVGFVRRRSSHQ